MSIKKVMFNYSGYFIHFGIAPSKNLIKEVNYSPFCSCSFDKSLNRIPKMKKWTLVFAIGAMRKVWLKQTT